MTVHVGYLREITGLTHEFYFETGPGDEDFIQLEPSPVVVSLPRNEKIAIDIRDGGVVPKQAPQFKRVSV